jgi:hypothetical protein
MKFQVSSFKFQSGRPGQGLLETIVALSVLTTGAVALVSLVISASVSRSFAEGETVAVNLAREGIEVTRSIRDTNWITGSAFDLGLYGAGSDFTSVPVWDPVANAWSLAATPNANAITDSGAILYRYTAAGGGAQGSFVQTTAGSAPANTVATNYRRLVTADEICSDYTTVMSSGSTCGGALTKIGRRVRSMVQWTERARTHSITVEERIYDWR